MSFSTIANKVSTFTGTPYSFVMAFALIIIWLLLGPYFNWSDSHSLFINTVTTIITFLMCFLIQTSQNKDTIAIMLKLDELIRAIETANNEYIKIEDLNDKQLKKKLEEIKEKV